MALPLVGVIVTAQNSLAVTACAAEVAESKPLEPQALDAAVGVVARPLPLVRPGQVTEEERTVGA